MLLGFTVLVLAWAILATCAYVQAKEDRKEARKALLHRSYEPTWRRVRVSEPTQIRVTIQPRAGDFVRSCRKAGLFHARYD